MGEKVKEKQQREQDPASKHEESLILAVKRYNQIKDFQRVLLFKIFAQRSSLAKTGCTNVVHIDIN